MGYGKYARYAPALAPLGGGFMGRSNLSWTKYSRPSGGVPKGIRGKKSRSIVDGKPATAQYDVKTRYAKTRMPGRKRKQWKKFKGKVNAVLNKNVAPTYFLFRETTSMSSTINSQAWASVMLYTANGTQPNNDLGRIAIGVQSAAGNQIASKYRFESACLDLLLRNYGTTQAIVDIYTIYCRKDVPDNYASPFELITNLDSIANQDSNSDSKITDSNIGYTPFHNPMFCSYYKVAKKQTLILAAGQVSEIQMRDSKNRKLYGIDYVGKTSMAGWTKGYLLCTRGAYNNVETPSTNVALAYTRSYCLRNVSDKTWISANV